MVETILPEPIAFLLPGIILAATALLVFAIDAADPGGRHNRLFVSVSGIGSLLAAGIAGWFFFAQSGDPHVTVFEGQLVVDQAGLLLTVIIAGVTSLILIGGFHTVADRPRQGEFYSLVLLAATGMVGLAHANSLLTAFIAFELASLPSYVLVAYRKNRQRDVEAGLKYFLIGAVSSATLLYGMSLVYATTGALQFVEISEALSDGAAEGAHTGLFGIGIVTMLVGLGFKIAAVPFHFWAPGAYGESMAPVGGFLSSASKVAGFLLVFRIFLEAFQIHGNTDLEWVAVFGVLAIVTMLVGNFAAVVQSDVKQMLAYSSVGHAGFVLIALGALGGSNTSLVVSAGLLHLFIYGVMNTGAFLFVATGEYWDLGPTFEDYAGLATQAPILAAAMTILLFNLAGLPIGGGFWSKYLLFAGAIDSGFWWLAAVGAFASAVSLYYYARLVKVMWFDTPADNLHIDNRPTGLYAGVVLTAALTTALLGFGLLFDELLYEAGTDLLF